MFLRRKIESADSEINAMHVDKGLSIFLVTVRSTGKKPCHHPLLKNKTR